MKARAGSRNLTLTRSSSRLARSNHEEFTRGGYRSGLAITADVADFSSSVFRKGSVLNCVSLGRDRIRTGGKGRKIQRLLIALTIVNLNLGLLVFSLAQPRSAAAQGVVPVLRGRALEIVDDRGRVRASITVFPADPTVKMPDGTTVIRRRCSFGW